MGAQAGGFVTFAGMPRRGYVVVGRHCGCVVLFSPERSTVEAFASFGRREGRPHYRVRRGLESELVVGCGNCALGPSEASERRPGSSECDELQVPGVNPSGA